MSEIFPYEPGETAAEALIVFIAILQVATHDPADLFKLERVDRYHYRIPDLVSPGVQFHIHETVISALSGTNMVQVGYRGGPDDYDQIPVSIQITPLGFRYAEARQKVVRISSWQNETLESVLEKRNR